MKLIRTKARNAILDQDLTRIAKECINIYHSRKYYRDDGTVDNNATDDYLSWDEATMSYTYVPTRGYIYFNFKAGLSDTAFKSTVVRNTLLNEFQRLNKWGWRTDVFVEHTAGSNQYTLERRNAEDHIAAPEMCVVLGQPFYTKFREYKFAWILTDDASLFQYSVPGKFPKMHKLVASLSTIVVDVAHKIDLPDNSHSTGFPPLNKNIDIMPKEILLSRVLGVDAHTYVALGGPAPESKCWGAFTDVDPTEKKPMWDAAKGDDKVHLVKKLGDLVKVEGAGKDAGDCCTVCRVSLFDRYYQVAINTKVTQRVHVCKFCAHYNKVVAVELASGVYRIAVAKAAQTSTTMIEVADMERHERDVLRRLQREIPLGTLTNDRPGLGDKYEFLGRAQGVLQLKGTPNLIGIMGGHSFHDALECVHELPDDTRVFQYRAVF